MKEAAVEIKEKLTSEKINEIVSLIPEEWLEYEAESMSPSEIRAAYIQFLQAKIAMIDVLVKEAEDAR